MSEPQSSLQEGFIRGFKLLVDRVDPGDVVPGCIQPGRGPPARRENGADDATAGNDTSPVVRRRFYLE